MTNNKVYMCTSPMVQSNIHLAAPHCPEQYTEVLEEDITNEQYTSCTTTWPRAIHTEVLEEDITNEQ